MTRPNDAMVWHSSFAAHFHAGRLDEIGQEIDEVRAALKLLGEGTPGGPIQRAGDMLKAISTAHSNEAARLRKPEPVDEETRLAVRRVQRRLLGGVSAAIALLFVLLVLAIARNGEMERRSTGDGRQAEAEQQWMAQTEDRGALDKTQ